jgi:hypothetical protein
MTEIERAALLWLLEDKRAELIHDNGVNAMERVQTIDRLLTELKAATDTDTPMRMMHAIQGGGYINQR